MGGRRRRGDSRSAWRCCRGRLRCAWLRGCGQALRGEGEGRVRCAGSLDCGFVRRAVGAARPAFGREPQAWGRRRSEILAPSSALAAAPFGLHPPTHLSHPAALSAACLSSRHSAREALPAGLGAAAPCGPAGGRSGGSPLLGRRVRGKGGGRFRGTPTGARGATVLPGSAAGSRTARCRFARGCSRPALPLLVPEELRGRG